MPILLCTGLHDHTDLDLADRAGVTDFISKPLFNWPLLAHRLRCALRAACQCVGCGGAARP